MRVTEIQPTQFLHDLWRRSSFGLTLRDRLILAWGQVAYTLRWRWPSLAPRGKVRARVACPGGSMVAPLRLDADDLITLAQVLMEPEYLWPEFEPETILDAGANCGFATVLMAKRYPNAQLAAVEPEPENLEALRSTLAENQQQAIIVEGALSPVPGAIELHCSPITGAHSIVPGLRGTGVRTVTVWGRTMEEILALLSWSRIGLLKLDVEGAEKDLFRQHAQWLSRVDAIVGELHGDYDAAAVQADLMPYGFRVEFHRHNRRLFLAARG